MSSAFIAIVCELSEEDEWPAMIGGMPVLTATNSHL